MSRMSFFLVWLLVFSFVVSFADDSLVLKPSISDIFAEKLKAKKSTVTKEHSLSLLAKSTDTSNLDFYITNGEDYATVKARFKNFLAKNPSRDEIVDAYREIVRKGRYGERGLNDFFNNFTGRQQIDPNIKGVHTAVMKLYTSSPSQLKGVARELLYMLALHNDSRFKILSMDEIFETASGKTDADILFEEVQTRQKIRMEVKDVTKASQSSDKARLLSQIDKMAELEKTTGIKQILCNRKEFISELKVYAQSKGIYVLENMSVGKANDNLFVDSVARFARTPKAPIVIPTEGTKIEGSSMKKGETSVMKATKASVTSQTIKQTFLEKLAKSRATHIGAAGAAGSLASLGLIVSSMNLVDDFKNRGQKGAEVKIARDSSFVVSSAALMGASVISILPEGAVLSSSTGSILKELGITSKSLKISTISKGLGKLGIAAAVVGSGLEITQIWTSDANREEKITKTGGAVGSVAGGVGGFLTGVQLGAIMGGGTPFSVPLAAIGGILGGLLGSAAGEEVGSAAGAYLAK